MWPVHAATGPAAEATPATLAALAAHVPNALVAAAKAAGVPRTLLHVCTDGRDTPPTSAGGYMASLEKRLAELGYGEISSITGRYYAMDRDKR